MTTESARNERILSGPLARELLRFGTPLAIGMGLQTAFNLLDAYLIGRLGQGQAEAALGAIGICDQLAAVGSIVSYGLTVASCSLLSRHEGAKEPADVMRVAIQSLLVICALSALFAIVGLTLTRPLLEGAVGAKGAVLALSVPYLRVTMTGGFSIYLLLHATSMLRALGSSKTPVALLILANAFNLLLALMMVFGPGPTPPPFGFVAGIARALHIPRMGLQGAAWATQIARTVMLLPLALIVLRRLRKTQAKASFRPDWPVLGHILNLGWASSAQLVVRIVAMLFTQALVARAFTSESDQTATTALGAVFRLETMALFIGLGWGSAAQTFVGQNLGAGHTDRAKASGWYAALFNAIMMAALAAFYVLDGERIVRFFVADPRVVGVGFQYLKWVAPSYVALGLGVALGSAMQGAGATHRALLLDASVVLLFQLPICLFAILHTGATPVNLWQAVAATYCALALVYVLSYWRGRFLRGASEQPARRSSQPS